MAKQDKKENLDKYELWQSVLGELELLISPANFKTWFSNTFISRIEDDGRTAVIAVPNIFTQNWLSQKYHKDILRALANITDNKIERVVYTIESNFQVAKQMEDISRLEKMVEKKSNKEEEFNKYGLNSRYTFDTFVVGKGNELAYAASKAVVSQPGRKYNPLFIYGGVGLGKTHLLQAIGHAFLSKNKKAKILYVNAEVFTNEFVESIRNGKSNHFKEKYRNLDLLLVDDVQFMAGKERTEEEFFHTFDSLHQEKKQIVITSDRPPKSLAALEKRIVSRFEWGLICDIAPPDLETRQAILKAKAKERGYKLDEEVINYLASHIQSNVRELEGALNKIFAWHELYNEPIDRNVAEKIIKSMVAQTPRKFVPWEKVLKEVADFYNIKPEEIQGISRKRELVVPRQVIMYLLREDLEMSFPAIGKKLGNRDHSTAMHGWEKVKKEVENDGRIKQEIDLIRQRIYND